MSIRTVALLDNTVDSKSAHQRSGHSGDRRAPWCIESTSNQDTRSLGESILSLDTPSGKQRFAFDTIVDCPFNSHPTDSTPHRSSQPSNLESSVIRPAVNSACQRRLAHDAIEVDHSSLLWLVGTPSVPQWLCGQTSPDHTCVPSLTAKAILRCLALANEAPGAKDTNQRWVLFSSAFEVHNNEIYDLFTREKVSVYDIESLADTRRRVNDVESFVRYLSQFTGNMRCRGDVSSAAIFFRFYIKKIQSKRSKTILVPTMRHSPRHSTKVTHPPLEEPSCARPKHSMAGGETIFDVVMMGLSNSLSPTASQFHMKRALMNLKLMVDQMHGCNPIGFSWSSFTITHMLSFSFGCHSHGISPSTSPQKRYSSPHTKTRSYLSSVPYKAGSVTMVALTTAGRSILEETSIWVCKLVSEAKSPSISPSEDSLWSVPQTPPNVRHPGVRRVRSPYSSPKKQKMPFFTPDASSKARSNHQHTRKIASAERRRTRPSSTMRHVGEGGKNVRASSVHEKLLRQQEECMRLRKRQKRQQEENVELRKVIGTLTGRIQTQLDHLEKRLEGIPPHRSGEGRGDREIDVQVESSLEDMAELGATLNHLALEVSTADYLRKTLDWWKAQIHQERERTRQMVSSLPPTHLSTPGIVEQLDRLMNLHHLPLEKYVRRYESIVRENSPATTTIGEIIEEK